MPEFGQVRRRRRIPTTVVLTLAILLGMAASAFAYTYDYQLQNMRDEFWYSKSVAHNYHYLRGENPSSYNYICIKLVHSRTLDNYGDVYCNYYRTGHHYAGDTGTYTFGRVDNRINTDGHIMNMHEEW